MTAAVNDTVSWRELVAEAAERLGDSMDAQRIAEAVGGWSGAELTLHGATAVTVTQKARVDDAVRRRLAGEPLQYVVGAWGFRYLDLLVDERVLIPRRETEVVVDAALVELDRVGATDRVCTVIDLGTGSGAIALAIATERVRTKVWATDRSNEALAVARANLAGVGRPAARVTLCEGDWFDALPRELIGAVDLVISNPPYVPDEAPLPADVAEWEPATALYAGHDGLDAFRTIVADAPKWLATGGALVMEHGDDQHAAVEMLVRATGAFGATREVADLSGRSRGLVAVKL